MSSAPVLQRSRINSPIGVLTLIASPKGLRCLLFSQSPMPKSLRYENIVDSRENKIITTAKTQLDEYFAGQRETFAVPLDLLGTPFQMQVWKSLTKVKFAATWSYGEQATSIGRPTAMRAVGSANSKNPVAIILPCHRIIASGGGLGGFSGGIKNKVWLLQHEQRVIALRS
ncbi:MAG: methylated-DNA--[protein]-cysteine S-methyltransferase [Ilumatobacteraceae bacterium]|nr:methylated-DNA--[protein]-cysteine S-methyltransferase [Ilumatobacteraceae bacterium]